MLDAIGALRAAVLAEATITVLVSTRVYVNRIPRSVIEAQDPYHPVKMLVLRQAGGSAKADSLPTETMLVTALCYGEDDYEADKVRRAVAVFFADLVRLCQADVLIHHINPVGGPIPLIDPDITWPAVAQTHAVLSDVREEAAP